MWFKRIKCCAFGCNLTLKSTWLWWETNSNQQSSREKETVVKRKTRAKRGFPSHKSSPKKERKQKRKRERKQESVTHSVDFFLLLLFLYFFTNAQLNRDTPMCCDRDRESKQSCYIKRNTQKERNNKKQAKFDARNTIYVLRAECGSFFSFARACHKSNASKQKNEEMRIYKSATSWTSVVVVQTVVWPQRALEQTLIARKKEI